MRHGYLNLSSKPPRTASFRHGYSGDFLVDGVGDVGQLEKRVDAAARVYAA